MAAEPGQAEPDLESLIPGKRRGRHGRRSRWLAWRGLRLRRLARRGLVPAAIPAVLVIVAVAGSPATYRSIEAATGHGTKGYFVCVHDADGFFRLPDGRISRPHVEFADPPPGLRPGTAVPALDTGDVTFVFARHGSRHWVSNAVIMSLVVAAAGLWTWLVPLRARRRRASGTPPVPGTGTAGPVKPVRPSLRGYFYRHPGLAIGIGLVAMAGVAGISVKRLMHARVSVHAAWLPAVSAGLAASLTLLGITAGAVWLAARQRRRTKSPLITSLITGLALAFLAGMVYTRPAVMPQFGPPETVTTAFQLAAIAFMVPLYSALAVLLAWLWLRSIRSGLAARRHGPSGFR